MDYKARLWYGLVVLLRVLFEIEHTGEFLRADILHLSAEPGTAICFDKKCIFREILLEPLDEKSDSHIRCCLVTLLLLQTPCQILQVIGYSVDD